MGICLMLHFRNPKRPHREKKKKNETNTKYRKNTKKYRQFFLFCWTNTKHHITNATKCNALISFSTYQRTIGYFILHHRILHGDWFFKSYFFALDLQERWNIYIYVYRIWTTSDTLNTNCSQAIVQIYMNQLNRQRTQQIQRAKMNSRKREKSVEELTRLNKREKAHKNNECKMQEPIRMVMCAIWTTSAVVFTLAFIFFAFGFTKRRMNCALCLSIHCDNNVSVGNFFSCFLPFCIVSTIFFLFLLFAQHLLIWYSREMGCKNVRRNQEANVKWQKVWDKGSWIRGLFSLFVKSSSEKKKEKQP